MHEDIRGLSVPWIVISLIGGIVSAWVVRERSPGRSFVVDFLIGAAVTALILVLLARREGATYPQLWRAGRIALLLLRVNPATGGLVWLQGSPGEQAGAT
jgi:hypothetical protein